MFNEIINLKDESISIHEIYEDDFFEAEKIISDKEVTRYLPSFATENNKAFLILGVYLDKTLVGIIECYNYYPNWNKISICIMLASDYRNKKIATKAIKLLHDYFFTKTDIKRITVHIDVEDKISLKLFTNLGYEIRKCRVLEDWGKDKLISVNKYVYEKWGSIDYQKIGEGKKTLVILPGVALKSTLGAAKEIAKNFQMFKNYTIYLFDDRSNIGKDYSLRERAGDVAAKMHMLKIKDAYVYGASMGGMVGQYLAIDHPDLVKKLYIASSAARMNKEALETMSNWENLAKENDLTGLIENMLTKIYSEEIVKLYGDAFASSIGEVSEDELDKFIILLKAIQNFDAYEELDKIKCPVYVIGSKGDNVLGLLATKELVSKLRCDSHIYGEEYGHAVYDELSDHNEKMLEFFERID